MENKNVLVIKNGLEDFLEIFTEVKKNSPFCFNLVDYDDFLGDKYSEILRSNKQVNIIIVISDSFLVKAKDNLKQHFTSIYKLPFRNIVIINPADNYKTDSTVLSGEKKIFQFYKSRDIFLQAEYFILFLINQFNTILLSIRVSDFISDSFKEVIFSEQLKKKKIEVDNLYKELEERSRIDYLTQLFNRAAMFEFLAREKDRALRGIWRLNESKEIIDKKELINNSKVIHSPQGKLRDHFGVFSLIMIDIDHFKAVNDNHGHLVGDKVLKKLGEYLLNKDIFRENDIAARFGGEEFIVILPETNAHHAVFPAERLANEFKMCQFTGKNKQSFNVTLSIGISEFYRSDVKCEELVHRADTALYYSKENGRDRITVYENITEYQKESN